MEILRQITRLFEVKSLLTLAAAAVFVVLALNGTLDSKDVLIILTLVFQSYFAYQNNKRDEEDKEDNGK